MKKYLLIAMTLIGLQSFAQLKQFCAQKSEAGTEKVDPFVSGKSWLNVTFDDRYGMMINDDQRKALHTMMTNAKASSEYVKIGTINTIKIYAKDTNGYNLDKNKATLDVYFNGKFYYFDYPEFESDGETSVPQKWYLTVDCAKKFLELVEVK